MSYGVSNDEVKIQFAPWVSGYDNNGCNPTSGEVTARYIREDGYSDRILIQDFQAANRVVTALNAMDAIAYTGYQFQVRYSRREQNYFQIEMASRQLNDAETIAGELNDLNITLPIGLVFPSDQER
jgi:hypothetical protein